MIHKPGVKRPQGAQPQAGGRPAPRGLKARNFGGSVVSRLQRSKYVLSSQPWGFTPGWRITGFQPCPTVARN